jgi:hypothetical protein
VGDVKHCRGVKEKLNLLYRIAADNSRLEGMLFVENMPVWYSFRSVLLDAIFLSHCFSFHFRQSAACRFSHQTVVANSQPAGATSLL